MNSFNDNELDGWLRQSAAEGHEPPASDGWDTPPESVWEQLRAGLEARRKRRRRLVWFLWPLVLVGLAGAGWYAGSAAFTRPRGSLAATSNAAPAKIGHQPKYEADDIPEQLLCPAWLEMTPLLRREDTSNQVTLEIAAKLPRSGVNAALPNTSGAAAGEMAYVKPAPRPDTVPLKKMSNVRVDFKTVSNPALLPVAITPLFGNQAIAPYLNLSLTPPVIRPWKDRPRLYAGLATGVFFTTRKLKQSGAGVPNGRENGAWTWQQGLSLGWKFHRNWALESGLQRTAVHLQAERRLRFRYRINQEQFDQQRFLYNNTANDVMETSFGAVEMRMDVGREPSRPVDDLAVFRVVLRTDEQARYWRVPVILRWSPNSRGSWHGGMSVGVGINFSAGYELSLDAARANRPGIRGISARLLGNADGLAPVMTDVQFGGQLGYRLSQRCTVSLMPEFRYGLGSMYRQGPFGSLACAAGVQAGIMLRL